MNDLTLSDSETTSIVKSLNLYDTYSSRQVLLELQRQGVLLPMYVIENLIEKGDIEDND